MNFYELENVKVQLDMDLFDVIEAFPADNANAVIVKCRSASTCLPMNTFQLNNIKTYIVPVRMFHRMKLLTDKEYKELISQEAEILIEDMAKGIKDIMNLNNKDISTRSAYMLIFDLDRDTFDAIIKETRHDLGLFTETDDE